MVESFNVLPLLQQHEGNIIAQLHSGLRLTLGADDGPMDGSAVGAAVAAADGNVLGLWDGTLLG